MRLRLKFDQSKRTVESSKQTRMRFDDSSGGRETLNSCMKPTFFYKMRHEAGLTPSSNPLAVSHCPVAMGLEQMLATQRGKWL